MERFHVWELEFRSTSPEDPEGISGYSLEEDEKYINFYSDINLPPQIRERKFVFNISDRENVKEVQLWNRADGSGGTWIPNTPENQAAIEGKPIWKIRDRFGNTTSQRICPCCHNDLPVAIGRAPNYILSMMGNTTSGKTVYLSRLLLSLLENGLLPSWGLTVDVVFTDPNPNMPKTLPQIKRYLRNMFEGKKENEKDKKVGKLSDATSITYMYPIILELRKGYETVLVTLFDFPGEAIWRLMDDELPFFKKLMRNLNENADGWLFLLDSTTLDPVLRYALKNNDEKYLARNLDDPNQSADPGSVLQQFFRFFGEGIQIVPPVALVLSKSDMIARYADQLRDADYEIDERSPFLFNSSHPNRSRVDLDDLWECDQAIRKFLKDDQVLMAAQNLCRQYAWFTASATGVPVESGQMGTQSAPAVRVVEPLEWLLWVLGAYAGERSRGNPLWGIIAPQDSDKE